MMTDSRLIKPTIQAQLVEELLEGAKSKGVDVRLLLEKAAVSPDVLHNLNTRISIQIYYRILSAIREYLQDEMLGFLEHKIPTRAFPVFCQAATGYPNYESLIRFVNDFYGLLTDEFRWELTTDQKRHLCALSIRFKKDAAQYKKFIIEFLMVTSYRAGSWLIGAPYPIQSVHFTFSKPEIIEKYQYLFNNQIFFEADRNKIIFDSGVLSQPVIRSQQDVSTFLRSSAGWFLLNPETHPYTRLVRQKLLTKDLTNGFPNFDELARTLNISHQHLWRKLNYEGTSYRQIKNQLRRDSAIHFLMNTQLNISEIAYRVGYAAERPFYRMFTQWTGISPGEYRRIFQMQTTRR
ncbi:MAG: AraC family transcriptional regulator ligand-binding domain-containing protein [Deltaproteobacteria bacterium]|nr:AraC family transcriptional regulator ligand-binding domain-containing protein [Deltaproteobacteria bacterium]